MGKAQKFLNVRQVTSRKAALIVHQANSVRYHFHDSGFAKLTFYDEERKKCLKEYPEYLYADGGFEFIYDKEWNGLSDILAEHIKCMIEQEQWERVGENIISYRKSQRKSSILEMLGILYNIWEKKVMQTYYILFSKIAVIMKIFIGSIYLFGFS